MNLQIYGKFLKEKLKKLAEKMNITVNFKAFNGWFKKVQTPHNYSKNYVEKVIF